MRRIIVALLLAAVAGCGGLKPPTVPAPTLRMGTAAEKRAAFAQAYEWFRHGDNARALPEFTALVDAYPELADYHLYFAGVIESRLQHEPDAQAAFSRLLRDYPQSVKAPAAGLELGKSLLRTEHSDQARAWLQNALSAADASIEQGARLALAEVDERNGAIAAASTGFIAVRRAVPGTAVAHEAKQHLEALRAQHAELEPTGSEALEEARLLLAEHDYAAAKAMAERLSMRAAAEGIDPAALLRILADALQGLGQTERALATLRTIVEHYPATSEAPEALFRVASLQWNRDQDAAALSTFEEFQRRYPQHARAADAVYAIGRIHQQAGRGSDAIRTFADLAHRYPSNKIAAEAQWRIGWIHYLDGDWTAATAGFAALAHRAEGRDRDAALYWQGRALERAGRSAAARQLYTTLSEHDPNSYYAMWAQRRLGETRGTDSAAPPTAPAAAEIGTAPINEPFHLARWDELKAAGVYTLARAELAAIERMHRDDPATARFLLRAYQTVDGYAAALRLLRRLGDGADLSSAERDRLAYPLAFWTQVRSEATTQGVDPLLVEAVMRQESMFDPEARSSADARGLLQLLPSTAKRVATSGDQVIDPNDLTQPELNVQLGVRYLRSLLDRFHSDMLKAVAAYNGGETAVEKWERQFATADADEFVENITYRETRDYVKRVVGNYRTYQQMYATPR